MLFIGIHWYPGFLAMLKEPKQDKWIDSAQHNGRTQLLFPSALNMVFRFFELRIAEPFPNEKLLRKKKIVATEQTIFHWETALGFTVQKI